MRRRLAAVFGVVVTAFVAFDAFVVVALWPQLRASEALTTRYAANSMLIARMGGAVRTIRSSATQHYVQLRSDPPVDDAASAAEVALARRDFARAAEAYVRTPMDARERDEWERLTRDAIPELVRTVELALLPRRDGERVQQATVVRLGTAAVGVADILERLAQLNAMGLESAGARIHAVVAELVAIAVAIGVIGLAGMMLLVRWALAAVRDHERSTAERLSELEQFAGRVAHDLRNPLQSIGLSLAVLERRAPDEAARSTVARAQDGVRRMTSFIQELLEFARSGANPDPGASASIVEAFRSVAQDLEPSAAERQVEVVIQAPVDAHAAIAPAALRAIVGNLADNAVKYMPADPDRPRRVELSAEQGGPEVRIRVRDTGAGIPPEALPHLFEPFFRATSRAGGFGIGLKTVKRLVDSHGGQISVDSHAGQGSVFSVTLPAAAAAPPADPPAHPGAAAGDGRTAVR